MTAPLLNTEETTRPRKPFNFRQELGTGFIWGSVIGSAYHLPKGGFQAVWTKVPRLSCKWAVLFGAYEAIHYVMVSARGKEEPVLNSAVAAAGAVGIASIPMGLRTAACAAPVFGTFGGALRAGLDKISAQQKDDPGTTPE